MRHLFILFCLLPALLGAQDSTGVDTSDYTLTVTADRHEQNRTDNTDAVEIITASQIEESQASTVLELLRDVAGVHIAQSGSYGKTTSVFVRGAGSTQVLVLIDGVKINDPFFGGVDLSSLPAADIERIEILKGPQSTLYGSEAVAGVIHIVTKSAGGKTELSGLFEAGGLSTYRESLSYGGGNHNWSYRLGISKYDSQGQFDNDEFDGLQLKSRAEYRATDNASLTVDGTFIDSHIGIPFYGPTPSPDRNSNSNLGIFAAAYKHRIHNGWNLTFRGSYTRNYLLFTDPDDFFSRRTKDLSGTQKLGFQNDAVFGSLLLTAGFESERQNVAGENENVEILDQRIKSEAAFAQAKLDLGPLLFTVGGRMDHHNSFGNHFSPRISAAYAPGNGWKVRAGAGTAFRAPSAGELAYPFYGNPELKPEIARSFEGGVDYFKKRGFLSITAFRAKYEDLISFDPSTFIAGNVDRATTKGIEISGELQVYRGWKISGTYTMLRTANEITGEPLFRRPENSGSLTANYNSSRWGANLNFTAVGRRLETDFLTFTSRYNPGYLKADAAGYISLWHGWSIVARIENFLDREYQEVLSFPAPGITGFVGIRASL